MSPTQTVVHLLALINTFSFGVIISTFIYCEIDVLPTLRTEKCVIFSLISMIFCYWKVYGASPTEIEKSDFFQILEKKIFFSDHFFRFSFISVKPPRRRRGRGVFGLNTPRQGGGGRGVFKPNTPMPSQGKVVLQFILRATD